MSHQSKGALGVRPDFQSATDNVLLAFAERGIATIQHVAQFSGKTYEATKKILQRMSIDMHQKQALLQVVSNVQLAGESKGRNVYILTTLGAKRLSALTGLNIRPPHLNDTLELTAAVMMLDVFSAAQASGLEASIETVLNYEPQLNQRNIRVDVYVGLADGSAALFECEQPARPWSRGRILDKLLRLAKFFSAPATTSPTWIDHDVRVLFNIARDDQETVRIWQEQFAEAEKTWGEELPYRLVYAHLSDFLQSPEWETTGTFQVMQPTERDRPQEMQAIPKRFLADLPSRPAADERQIKTHIQMLAELYQEQNEYFQRYQDAQDHLERCVQFFRLMKTIYLASYERNSPARLYAAVPVESLFLLKTFLHLPDNQGLLKRLKRNLALASQHAQGMVRYQNAITNLFWDFLQHFGFARGGALSVRFEPPSYDTGATEFSVGVRVLNPAMLGQPDSFRFSGTHYEEESALAWALYALLVYTPQLELGEPTLFVTKRRAQRQVDAAEADEEQELPESQEPSEKEEINHDDDTQ